MKKFFLIAAAAAMVLSSCSKNSVSEDTSAGNAIGFGTYSNKATKADGTLITGNALGSGAKFGVWGYLTLSANWSTGSSVGFMKNQEVDFDGSKYDYNPKRYWPKDEANNKLSFYAYYPFNGTGITPTVTTGLGSYTFTVQHESKNQIDFMVSNLAKNLTYTNAGNASTATDPGTGSGTPGLVKLAFHHMLTQVNVKLATTADKDTKVSITSITFKGIKNSGTLTVKPNTANDDMDTPATNWWATNATTDDFPVTLSASSVELPTLTLSASELADPATIATSKYISVSTANEGSLLMIPNSFGTNPQIEIKYDYVTTVNSDKVKVSDTATATLSTAWEMNTNVTYYLMLDLNSRVIKFTAEVVKWTDQDNTPIILK
jgi:hypothetical protein